MLDQYANAVLQQLEKLQLKFYRSILAVGSGCPLPIIYWDTGGMLVKYRIIKRKLLFFHHLENLPPDCLAKEIVEVQKVNNLPGLVKECLDVLHKAGIYDVASYSKKQWKNVVDKLCKKMNEDDLLQQMKNYKKLDLNELKQENCKLKDYMSSLNLHSARLRFKIRAKMTPTIQMNFKSDKAFKANNWICLGCDSSNLDTQAHV